ncbi:MAG TPA: cyclic peptide export ABC transporter [Longimicrobium sp.]|nr:cyclic peptide export ABC transporter [Longimicrobium sp.]
MPQFLKLLSFLLRQSDDPRGAARRLAVVVVLGVIGGGASTVLLMLINTMLADPAGISAGSWGSFAALCVLLPVSRFVSQVLLVRLTQATASDLRLRLTQKILSAPLARLEKLGAPRMLASLTDDVQALTSALTNVPVMFLHGTVVVSCLAYMAWLSWQLFGFVLATVVLGIVSYQIPLAGALRHFRQSRQTWDVLFGHFRGLIEGAKELKLHRPRRHAFVDRQLGPTVAALRGHNTAGGTIHALANCWGQVLFFILIGAVLYVGPKIGGIEAPVLTGYTLAILYMLTPLDVVMNQITAMGRGAVAAQAVEQLGLSLPDEPRDGKTAPASFRSLEMVGVTHRFHRENEDEVFHLGPLDVTLTPGELVFVVGGNGSGKTTFAKLLTALYAPESGEIRLDGRPVGPEESDDYRQLFSAVFSDFFLFEVLLGQDGERLDDRTRAYLSRLHLDRKVKVKDGTLSTTELSAGQRKRLALLTAYLEDRPVYLFDEWAADQDPQFKDVFYRQLLPELRSRGKAVVVITHDDRYYGVADRIVRLDDGRIVYDGSVEDLPVPAAQLAPA